MVAQNLSVNWDERSEAHSLLDSYSKDEIVIYDRGYFSYKLAQDHLKRGVNALFRIQKGIVSKEIAKAWKSKDNEFFVKLSPSVPTLRKARNYFPEENVESIELRLIKYRIKNETYLLATTILDRKIKAEDFISLYQYRWMIEEFLKNIKVSQELEEFHSKTKNGVEQEIAATSILWNMTQFIDGLMSDFKKTLSMLKSIPLPIELPSSCAMVESKQSLPISSN